MKKRNFTEEELKEIWDYYNEMIEDPVLIPLIYTKQHHTSNTYKHVCSVTKAALTAAIKKRLDIDYKALIRGGLLHDLFFYNWRNNKIQVFTHGFKHPKVALENAEKEFLDLSKKEKDIIRNHMWPLTLFHIPKCKESWLISRMDKIVSVREALAPKNDAIVFDLDGTLFDTVVDVYDALEVAFTQNGFKPMTLEQLKPRMGYKMRETIALYLPEGTSDEIINKILLDYRTYYKNHSVVKVKPYPRMFEILQILKRDGYHLAVATNKTQKVAEQIIDKFFPNIFEAIQGDDGHTPLKPLPASFQIVKKKMAKAARYMYVGDTEVDYQTAKAAGAEPILVTYGYRDKQLLDQFDAVKVNSPVELLKYIERKTAAN